VTGTSRRRLLKGGLAGAALLGAGGALSWLRAGYSLPPGEIALALSVKEMRIVRAIVEALLPGGGGMPSGIDAGVHQRIDEELWSQPDDVRSDLAAAIQLLEHAPPIFGFFGRLTRLEPADRARAIGRMLEAGPDVIVQAAVAIKQLAHLFYFGHPDVWPHLGYDGSWVEHPRPPPSAVAYRAELHARRGPS
jgi:hypothetical protein